MLQVSEPQPWAMDFVGLARAWPSPRLDAFDRELLADPGFARLYHRRDRLRLDLAALTDSAPGSLAHEYLRFMAHYRLEPRFFPARTDFAAMRPCEYAATRLADIHDFIHVIGEYETSDADEVAIQSFVAGQAPLASALFLRNAFEAPDIAAPGYVHLRQLRGRALSLGDFARGREAAPLLALDVEAELATPIAALRERLRLAPRVGAADIVGVSDVTGLFGGDTGSCVTTASGRAWCWGTGAMLSPLYNPPSDRQFGPSALDLEGVRALYLGHRSVAYLADGSALIWGYSSPPTPILDVVEVRSISGLECVVRSSGEVACTVDGKREKVVEPLRGARQLSLWRAPKLSTGTKVDDHAVADVDHGRRELRDVVADGQPHGAGARRA